MIVFAEKLGGKSPRNAEKFLLVLAVSLRNRQSTVGLFLPEARFLFLFFFFFFGGGGGFFTLTVYAHIQYLSLKRILL